MSRFSSSSQAALNALMGRQEVMPNRRRWEFPTSAGPVLVKVSDPFEDLDEVVERLEDTTPEGRRANSWLARRKRWLAQTADGQVALDGRVCCAKMAMELDRVLWRLTLPSTHVCPVCGTTWRVENGVQEPRHHG